VPSILVGSETDPWMPVREARELARQLGSTFVNLGEAGHINTAAGFGPWPRAKFFIETLVHGAAKRVFGSAERGSNVGSGPSHRGSLHELATDGFFRIG
jgi:hypothetical protein